ncbi:MAG: SprT-like domain-containing protein [Sulfurimonas sp.]|nr:SprT-like domain-containing protein [Sulfurimonas sp.]
MFTKKLEFLFIGIIIIAIVILVNNWYSNNKFKNNPISDEYQELISRKEQEILYNMQQHYNIIFKVPLIITDKFKGKLYGATSYRNGKIKIYLNKNVMQESMEYMINSVIAHEYAHALMFKMGFHHSNSDGHSSKWKEMCTNLGGINCERYVDREEIIMSKMPF